MTSFAVTRARGKAAALVRVADTEVPPGRHCVLRQVTDRAVVLGSTQPSADVDEAACASRGIEVVRRRSGGGAVFVEPGAQLWADFFVPAGDPLFASDVGRSFAWLGAVWAAAIRALSDELQPVVVAPGTRSPELARHLCFAGVGAGEVVIGDRKVVGISQRRNRDGAWLFSMAVLRDTVDELATCLIGDAELVGERAAALRSSSGVLGLDGSRLEAELLKALP